MSVDDEFAKSEHYYRSALERGDKGALLRFLHHCFMNNRAVPGWAQDAFSDIMRKVRRYEVKSFDEVFGRPLKKGAQLATGRRKQRAAPLIWDGVCARRSAGEPITKALFDAVGKEAGVSGTVAAEIYYELVEEMEKELGDMLDRS
jgi:hypothetical protein